jgi:amylosucrase
VSAEEPDEVLAGLSADRRELFELRVERWLPDLRSGLADLYPAEQARRLEQRLLQAAATAYRDRAADLHRLDLQRTLAPDWFQSPRMLGYAAYADRFAGDLAGLRDQLPYLSELGVTYLHLMPLLRPRDGDSDGGYAVADYRSLRPDLGTVEDLRLVARDMRRRGISLVLDLVLNHVAYEHPWAQAARAGDQHHRGYFHVYPDRTEPDAYERTLPEVFPDFAPGNFTWDDDLQAWVWTTFNSFQWDVDWANPDVFAEYADIVLWLANVGVEVIRLDAIAFLWKRLGTTCQNQPEVHSIAQALRALLRIAAPAVLLKAEAIVGPDDLVHYLGTGRHHGKVSDLAYHNTLMVQIWSMLASRDARLAAAALQCLPPVPTTTAWICYLRCHDDIGWAIDDRDAASVGLDGYAHRSFLSDFYSGAFPGSFAEGEVFQFNPATGDRRISGMAASLAGLAAAERAGDAAAVDMAVRRLTLAYALVLGWGGIPVLWMGDEVGLPSDPDWAAEPGHAGDNRWLHRPRMDSRRVAQRHDLATAAGQLFAAIRHLVAARTGLVQLHAATTPHAFVADDPGVLLVHREHPEGDLLQAYNVTDQHRSLPLAVVRELGLGDAVDALAAAPLAGDGADRLPLAPYQAMWLARRG